MAKKSKPIDCAECGNSCEIKKLSKEALTYCPYCAEELAAFEDDTAEEDDYDLDDIETEEE